MYLDQLMRIQFYGEFVHMTLAQFIFPEHLKAEIQETDVNLER